MNYLKVSEFINSTDEMPFLLGAFFGRYQFSNDNKFIYTLSTYKASKKLSVDENDKFYLASKDEYLKRLNLQSELPWHKNENKNIKNAEFIFILENDLNLTPSKFYSKLYIKILSSDFISNKAEMEAKKKFTRAFFELRGSIDTSRPLLAKDYFYNNVSELKRISLFFDNIGISINVLNINFRDLQEQFISGENKRNTQLRVNLYWYLSQLGLINPYKAGIVKKIYNIDYNDSNNGVYTFECQIPEFSNNSFADRVNFYASRILNQDLTQRDIDNLRKELNFDDNVNQDFKRDMNIINVVKFQTKDECAACKNIYDIKDRSFALRKHPQRWYTEIHHFVSVGKEKQLDVIENLTKLCPTCHRALGKGKTNPDYQKELISNIIDANPNNFEFACLIFESNNKEEIIQKVYENLK
ncbi:HNH endonuclease [Campylobacter sp.]|uniref:HNH endonuclease n=1 Tax=Campylobacter sp. TaxID=205 RepID=UPI00259CEFB5|nr:HNH endonuclease [Campylobacter sp.]